MNKWTKTDIEDTRALKRIFPKLEFVEEEVYAGRRALTIFVRGENFITFPTNAIPSLEPYIQTFVSDIIGEDCE